jgi:hypothetical protein
MALTICNAENRKALHVRSSFKNISPHLSSKLMC